MKTRLTTLKDGIFAPEVASGLYPLHAVRRGGDHLLGHEQARGAFSRGGSDNGRGGARRLRAGHLHDAREKNVEVMRKLFDDAGTWPRELVMIADAGASFDEHYNHAFDQVWERGADCILSMGADMPALTANDVVAGFEALHKLDGEDQGGIVLAPDQEMGVSVIGWTRATDFDHSGVFYNQEGLTVLPAYIRKARSLGLPAIYLPPIPDVDTMADLRHGGELGRGVRR